MLCLGVMSVSLSLALFVTPSVLIFYVCNHRVALIVTLLEAALLEILLRQLLLEPLILLLHSLLSPLHHRPQLHSLQARLFCIL